MEYTASILFLHFKTKFPFGYSGNSFQEIGRKIGSLIQFSFLSLVFFLVIPIVEKQIFFFLRFHYFSRLYQFLPDSTQKAAHSLHMDGTQNTFCVLFCVCES